MSAIDAADGSSTARSAMKVGTITFWKFVQRMSLVVALLRHGGMSALWSLSGCKADVPHQRLHRPKPASRLYRLFPALRLSTDGYPRRRNAASIPSSTTSWIFSRSSNAIFRSTS